VEELRTEPLLQARYRSGYGLRRRTQSARGFGERPLVGDRHECGQTLESIHYLVTWNNDFRMALLITVQLRVQIAATKPLNRRTVRTAGKKE
jgi:hypothetical protein